MSQESVQQAGGWGQSPQQAGSIPQIMRGFMEVVKWHAVQVGKDHHAVMTGVVDEFRPGGGGTPGSGESAAVSAALALRMLTAEHHERAFEPHDAELLALDGVPWTRRRRAMLRYADRIASTVATTSAEVIELCFGTLPGDIRNTAASRTRDRVARVARDLVDGVYRDRYDAAQRGAVWALRRIAAGVPGFDDNLVAAVIARL